MDDKIRIAVELFGAERAEEYMEKFQGYINSLNGKKLRLKVDNTIKEIEADLRKIKNSKVQIKLKKDARMAEFKRELDAITKKRHTIDVKIRYNERKLAKLRESLAAGKITQEKFDSESAGINKDIANLNRLKKLYSDIYNFVNDKKKNVGANYDDGIRKAEEGAKRLKMVLDQIKNTDITPRFNVAQMYQAVRNFTMRMGSAMQSLGNGMQKFTAPLDTFLRGTAYAAAYKALNTVTEGLSGSFERYDIMKTYPKIMKSMGESSAEAEKSVNKLYNSVLGLPTGLDTIVEAQKQYYLATNDMKKATKIAIAANNAFVAGGADDVQILQGQRQLRDFMSAGKLRVSEWESLAKAMPGAFKAIQDELKVTRADIMSGKVSADEFADTLIKVGSKGGEVYKAAQQMKHTFTAVGANIRNALRNAGMETIEALDKVLMDYDGGDVIDHLLKIKPAIVGIKDSITDWIKANPDKVIGFFERLKKLDVKGFLQGIVDGFATFGNMGLKVLEFLNGFGGASVGKFLVYFHTIGKLLSAFGGIFRGGAAPISGATTGFVWLGSKLFEFIKNMNKASKAADPKSMGRIQQFFSKFRSNNKAMTAAAKGADMATASTALTNTASQSATMAVSFKQIGANFLKAATPAALAVTYMGTVWASVKMIADISKTKINWEKTVENLSGASIAIGYVSAFMASLGKLSSLAGVTLKASGITALTTLMNSGVFTLVGEMLGEIQKIDLGKGYFDIHAKIGQISLAMLQMEGMMLAIGAISAGIDSVPVIGQIKVALEAIGALSTVVTSGAFLAATEALDRIAKLKLPKADKINKVVEGIKNLKDGLLNESVWETFKTSLKASDMASVMEDMAEGLGYVVDSFTHINTSATKIQQFAKQGLKKEVINTAKNKMLQLKDAMSGMFDVVADFFGQGDKQVAGQRVGGAQGADVPDFSRFEEYAKYLEDVSKMLDAFVSVTSKFGKIKKALDKAFAVYGEDHGHNKFINMDALEADIQQIVGMVKAITGQGGLGELQGVTEKLNGVNIDTITAKLQSLPKVFSALGKLRSTMAKMNNEWLKPVGSVDMMKDFNARAFGASGNTGMTKVGEKPIFGTELQSMITDIQNAVTALNRIGDEMAKADGIAEKAQTFHSAVLQVKKAMKGISNLRTVATENGKQKGKSVDSIAKSIAKDIERLNTALANAPQLNLNAAALAGGIKAINKAFKAISGAKGGGIQAFLDGLGKIPEACRKVREALQSVTNKTVGLGAKWKTNIVEGFKGTAEGVTTEIGKIKTALNELDLGAFTSAGLSAGNAFVNGFNSAMSNLSMPSVNGMSAYEYTSTGGRGYRSRYPHTGGLITKLGVQYRSLGGVISNIFKPKGTDTVPAMLTPGEYVMNKKATKTLGVPFMQRLNHLDLKGAMQALYNRGGQLAYATPMLNIDRSTHNTYNNNQQVHLTNNNASQSYTESRASRYIRKL